jgi:hypothetical protein
MKNNLVDPLTLQLNSVLSKYNLAIVIIVVFFVLVGVGVGLGAFFGLQVQDEQRGYEELNQLTISMASRLSVAVENAVRSVYSVTALFAYTNGTVDFYTDFLPFTTIAQLVVNGTAAVEFTPVVYRGQEEAFVNAVRSYGMGFNYTY